MRSLRSATRCTCGGRKFFSPWKSFSVSSHAKLRITRHTITDGVHNVKRSYWPLLRCEVQDKFVENNNGRTSAPGERKRTHKGMRLQKWQEDLSSETGFSDGQRVAGA